MDRPERSSGVNEVRDWFLRLPLAEDVGRWFLRAYFRLVQSRVRASFGDSVEVPLGKLRFRLDLTEIHDVRMYWSIQRYFGYEPETSRLLPRLLRSGDVFVDVGANNGYFAILASQFVGPSGTVYAIEPNPVAVDRLRRNVVLNQLASVVRVLSCAVGAKDGHAELSISTFEDGWASLAPFPTPRPRVPVRVFALDHLIDPAPAIVLKVDAEGAEPTILEGLEETLARTPNVAIILEWNHLFGSKAWWDWLSARFRVYTIVERPVMGVVTQEIQSWESLRRVFLKNLLLVSGERWTAASIERSVVPGR
ncbi:MAG: FkbM family methyltransferase [Thermoplasmata archaeon]